MCKVTTKYGEVSPLTLTGCDPSIWVNSFSMQLPCAQRPHLGPQASCTDWVGSSHPAQSGFLKELPYLCWGVKTHQQKGSTAAQQLIILNPLSLPIADLDPHSSVSSFLFLSVTLYLPHALQHTLHHCLTSPSGSSLFLVWYFHHWYFRIHPSLSTQLQDSISRMRASRLEHLVLMERNGGESVSDSPEANFLTFNN